MRRRQWFWVGLLGSVVGIAVRLVKGRRGGESGQSGWDAPREGS